MIFLVRRVILNIFLTIVESLLELFYKSCSRSLNQSRSRQKKNGAGKNRLAPQHGYHMIHNGIVCYLEQLRIWWWGAGRGHKRQLNPPHMRLIVPGTGPLSEFFPKLQGYPGQGVDQLLHPGEGEAAAVARIPE